MGGRKDGGQRCVFSVGCGQWCVVQGCVVQGCVWEGEDEGAVWEEEEGVAVCGAGRGRRVEEWVGGRSGVEVVVVVGRRVYRVRVVLFVCLCV